MTLVTCQLIHAKKYLSFGTRSYHLLLKIPFAIGIWVASAVGTCCSNLRQSSSVKKNFVVKDTIEAVLEVNARDHSLDLKFAEIEIFKNCYVARLDIILLALQAL